MIQKKPGQLR